MREIRFCIELSHDDQRVWYRNDKDKMCDWVYEDLDRRYELFADMDEQDTVYEHYEKLSMFADYCSRRMRLDYFETSLMRQLITVIHVPDAVLMIKQLLSINNEMCEFLRKYNFKIYLK